MFKSYLLSVTALLIGFFGIGNEKQSDIEQSAQPENSEMEVILNQYGTRAYKSFYSLDRFRPVSIIHIDKISEMYDNKWISPDEIVNILSDKDMKSLKNKISDIIETMEPSDRTEITRMIKSWCVADEQFDILLNSFGFARSELLKAIYDSEKTRFLFYEFRQQGSPNVNMLDPDEKDKALNIAKNTIANMSKKEQLEYYSEIYNLLALIVKN